MTTATLDSGDSIVIAARYLPTYYGGLGQYQRILGEHLSQEFDLSGIFLGETVKSTEAMPTEADPKWKFVVLDEQEKWSAGRIFCSKLSTKPFLHGLVEKIVSLRWAYHIKNALPPRLKAIHYVGTGWDFFGFALLHVARQKGIPFTVWPAVHPGQWGDDIIDIRLYQKADKIFAQSDHEKAYLTEKGVPGEKIIRCGLPPMCLESGSAAKFRSRHGLGARPLVLFLGRKDEGKGYMALLEAWAKVRARIPSACLIAAGPQQSPIKTTIGQEVNGILDLGMVSEEDKADALAACDVFCLPSAHESFGIVYIEAWSYGKPVICGTAPACRELIADNVDGLWSSQNPDELSNAIAFLLLDPSLAAKMGRRGKEKQTSKYTWLVVGQLHYNEFLG
jgi:glycosyltransferase involved in cell wall biosynthesis